MNFPVEVIISMGHFFHVSFKRDSVIAPVDRTTTGPNNLNSMRISLPATRHSLITSCKWSREIASVVFFTVQQ